MDAIIWLRYGPSIKSEGPVSGIDKCAIDYGRILSDEFSVTVVGRGIKKWKIKGKTEYHAIKAGSESEYLEKSTGYINEKQPDILHCMTHKHYLLLQEDECKIIQHYQTRYAPMLWSHFNPQFHSKPRYTPEEKKFMSSRLEQIREWTEKPNEGVEAAIACSNFIKENALIEAGVPVEVIYNFVDFEEVGEPEYDKEDYVLFVGALVPAKGVQTLLKAADTLEEDGCKTRIKVIGSAGIWNMDEDESVVGELTGMENVDFLGPKSHGDVIGYMKKAKIGVVPSVFPEPFGLVAAEYQACGTPVIASDTGGLPEVVEDGKTGVLVQPNKAEQLAEKITQLMNNPRLREKMGAAGRARVEKLFNAEIIKKQYIRLYSELAEK